MRADRLLSILLLLQTHRRITARDLAHRLDVSERTIHRDMEALGSAGVPVWAERGTGGGWSLSEDYRTNLTGLTEAEVRALFVAGPARLLADLGWKTTADGALIKLLAALPPVSRSSALGVAGRIHLDATGWHGSDESFPLLSTLQEALFADRKLDLAYTRGDGTVVEQRVEPLGLVAKGNVWYLVARADGEFRTYRVSRMGQARVVDESFVRPPDFDLAAIWKESSAAFVRNLPRYPARLRVQTDLLARLRGWRFARVDQVEPETDGWVEVAVTFEVAEEAQGYVLSLGPGVEVREPSDLRQTVADLLDRAAALYPRKRSEISEQVGAT